MPVGSTMLDNNDHDTALNIAVQIVSILPVMCNSSNPSSRLLGTILSATTIGITSILMFHRFFSSHASSKHLFFTYFYFHSVISLNAQIHIMANFLFLLF